jgi:hypothetical protein
VPVDHPPDVQLVRTQVLCYFRYRLTFHCLHKAHGAGQAGIDTSAPATGMATPSPWKAPVDSGVLM